MATTLDSSGMGKWKAYHQLGKTTWSFCATFFFVDGEWHYYWSGQAFISPGSGDGHFLLMGVISLEIQVRKLLCSSTFCVPLTCIRRLFQHDAQCSYNYIFNIHKFVIKIFITFIEKLTFWACVLRETIQEPDTQWSSKV